jgi:uncharacterized protein with FMN-binding domain
VRRAPLVLAATAAGLAAVLAFHTRPAALTVPGALGAAPSSPSSSSSSPVASGAPPRRGGSGPAPRGTGAPAGTPASTTPPTSSTVAPQAVRHATGAAVDYSYGVLSVAVTVTGRRITNVRIASLDDGGNFRSQFIDEQAIPILEQQALQAQSANIQGVSGATYTSAGFAQSLQSALRKLGL